MQSQKHYNDLELRTDPGLLHINAESSGPITVAVDADLSWNVSFGQIDIFEGVIPDLRTLYWLRLANRWLLAGQSRTTFHILCLWDHTLASQSFQQISGEGHAPSIVSHNRT